jgi:hypothetical protein
MREPHGVGRALRQRRGEDPEVGDLDVALGGDDHVRRCEPEVREPAAVRVTHRARRLRDECECTARREQLALQARFRDQAQRIEAGDVLDGGERRALRDAELAHARDPRMLEAPVAARRGRQRARHRRRRGQLVMKSFDRKLPLETGDAEHLRTRNRATGTDTNRLQELVAAYALRRGCHRISNVLERGR